MKKILAMIMVLLLVAAALPMSALAATTKTVYISSTGSGSMNVRSGPGKGYSVNGYVHHKDTVDVLDKSGEWSKVKVHDNGVTGWIKTKYIDGTTKDLGTGTKAVKVSSGSNLNLRTGPGTSYGIKGTVANGAAVKVLNTEGDWVKVTVSSTGKTGWIMAKYIGGASSGSSSGSSASGSSSTSSASNGKVYRVTSSTLNMRTGAGTSFAKVAVLSKGDAVKVTGSNGNWFKVVTPDGKSGWVSKSYLTAGAYATVTATTLNMRKGAGTGYAWVGALKYGASVTVSSVSGNWAYVSGGGKSGYVSLNYLKF